MNIKYATLSKRFSEILCGDVFECNGYTYMKIDQSDSKFNAVKLHNGTVTFFTEDTIVIPRENSELIIK